MKKSLVAVIAVLLFAGTGAARAGALVDLTVINRATGERIPVHSHRGRLYVPGTPGARYSLLISNLSGERVLAVTSVDGVNVITGETAAPSQSGYVLEPWGSVDIGGWRKSMSEVAAFFFTPLPDSYAARTERPGNVGVIGVAVFREFRAPPPAVLQQPFSGLDRRESEARSSSPAAPAADLSSRLVPRPAEKLGTGHGEREASAATWTDFRRASATPSEMIAIYYDSRANLIARGIIPGRAQAAPNPFPGFRFAPDPRS